VYFDLYVILDIFSRYVVGWTVAAREDSLIAKELMEHAIGMHGIPEVIHADSKYGRCQVFPGFVTLTPIDPRGYRGVGGVLAAS